MDQATKDKILAEYWEAFQQTGSAVYPRVERLEAAVALLIMIIRKRCEVEAPWLDVSELKELMSLLGADDAVVEQIRRAFFV